LLIILALAYNGYRLKRQNVLELIKKEKTINQQKRVLENILSEKEKLLEEKGGLLKDKEILIKEVHHRIKNNLHMVSSLLESQSAYLNSEALIAVKKSQHRIHAISLIHQKLYVNDHVTEIFINSYIREIVSYLKESLLSDEQIIFEMNLDNILLDVSQAVPIGLILNEAITNSIKYAFIGGSGGIIKIDMIQKSNSVILTISDNGIGLPQQYQTNDNFKNSLGINLIKGLGKSIQGQVSVTSIVGTKVEVVFNIQLNKEYQISRE